ncbi:MAG: hypothetical protein MZU84_06670 [Sphingobacterium sp.]|nr:hypothetical protein [Sphingobacterium sp.]
MAFTSQDRDPMFDTPHRRFNPLTGESVLVSPPPRQTSLAGAGRKDPA